MDIHVKYSIIACHVLEAVAHYGLERPMTQILQAGGEVYAYVVASETVKNGRIRIVIRMVVPSTCHLLLSQLVDRRRIGCNAGAAAGTEAEVHLSLIHI